MERWATFDCYGTLIDWDAGIASALGALWPDEDPHALLQAYHAAEPTIERRVMRTYREVLALGARAVAGARELPLPDGAESALADSLPSWPPFPEVPEALGRARRAGWRLAVLSNTDPDLLAGSIERIGIEPDLAITVADSGTYKPAPGHWERFFERSGAAPSDHVHVAASLFHDVEPCARLGLRCVWVNRAGQRSGLARTAELPDLSSLAETLARLSG